MEAFEDFPIRPFGPSNADSMQEHLAELEAAQQWRDANRRHTEDILPNADDEKDTTLVGSRLGPWDGWEARAAAEVDVAIQTARVRNFLQRLPTVDGPNIERGSE